MGPLVSVILLQRSARRSTVSAFRATATAARRLPGPLSLQLVTGIVTPEEAASTAPALSDLTAMAPTSGRQTKRDA